MYVRFAIKFMLSATTDSLPMQFERFSVNLVLNGGGGGGAGGRECINCCTSGSP